MTIAEKLPLDVREYIERMMADPDRLEPSEIEQLNELGFVSYPKTAVLNYYGVPHENVIEVMRDLLPKMPAEMQAREIEKMRKVGIDVSVFGKAAEERRFQPVNRRREMQKLERANRNKPPK